VYVARKFNFQFVAKRTLMEGDVDGLRFLYGCSG
jgi:hypothetical protein